MYVCIIMYVVQKLDVRYRLTFLMYCYTLYYYYTVLFTVFVNPNLHDGFANILAKRNISTAVDLS